MLHANIVMIDQTGKIPFSHLTHTAAAIQTQVNRDLAKFWPGVGATVQGILPSAAIPKTAWPVYIVDKLGDGEGGYHWMNGSNQPYAEVLGGTGWTVSASHEICEMIIDPYGNRLQSGPQIMVSQLGAQSLGTTQESYLVEVCDPCEAKGYLIGNVPVSDFITPDFYAAGTTGGRYSFTGAITSPLFVAFGGYISWLTAQDEMMQLLWLDPNQPPQIQNLGPATGKASLKEHVDNKTGATKRISAGEHDVMKAALAAGFVP